MTSAEIRQSYLDFFKSKGHTIVPSSSLLPDSPGLLFTNAGMNQFVPIFLNEMPCPYKPARAADTQKCIRAGGKHNDLEDVGLDTYHHTLFEMLGNWSFGDYFKKEAIEWAWELVVGIWKFPANRVYATVYSPDKSKGDPADFDQEAYDIWAKFFTAAGLHPKVHIVNGNKKDNFWMMGETGPCGPCSELHIDLTPEGDTKGSLVNTGDARCIEIWNLVFIQFNAGADGSFKPLPAKHIDTGMGFERVCSIIQGTKNFTDFKNAKISNYETDVFSPIFRELEKLSGKNYGCTLPKFGSTGDTEQEKIDIAFRVIADHIRTLSLSAADGIIPGNEGRNYVLRRILRRAVRYGRELGFHEMFFYKLVGVVVKSLGSVFPELIKNQAMVEKVLKGEEESFSKTLDRGIEMFNEQVSFILRSAGVPPAASGILPEASSSPSPGATYRKRRLPHYERPHGIYHITFTTQERRKLDDGARSLVKEAFLHFHGERYLLMAVCVMPDHVHAILQPKPKGNDKSGNLIFHTLSEILHSIKSFTAKEINKAGGKSGSVWEVEFFDRLMKSDAELAEVFEYLCANPCKEGLVGLDEPYPWLWTGCEEEDFRQDAGNGRRDACAPGQEPVISGEFAFKLYDTYGFPLDLTQLMARERGLTVDVEGFEKLMTEQRERSRAAQKKEIITVSENDGPGFKTDFVGYDQMENVAVQVLTHEIDFPKDPEGIVKARLFFSPSPFYAEMGGQVGDTGWLDFTDQSIEILDTVKAGGSVVHLTEDVPLLEALSFPVTARVDVPRRRLIQGHHSATHILHWALREVLGPNVRQKGSYVGPDRLRFDFAHIEAMKPEEIRKVEELANERIRENAKVMWMERPYAEVKNDPTILQFFGDKYGETVRVVDIGGFSRELCGGTHVRQSGDIGFLRIVSESAIAAGVRRLEAVAGEAIRPFVEEQVSKLQVRKSEIGQRLAGVLPWPDVTGSVEERWSALAKYRDELAALEERLKEEEKAKAKGRQAELQSLAAKQAPEWAKQADKSGSVPFLALNIGEGDAALIQTVLGELKKHFEGVAVLASVAEGKASLGASVSPAYVGKIKAGDIIKQIAPLVGGKGGGRPDMAQGGGTQPEGIPAALAKVAELVKALS